MGTHPNAAEPGTAELLPNIQRFAVDRPIRWLPGGIKGRYQASAEGTLIIGDPDEIQESGAKVDQADGKLILPPNLPPPGSLAVAYAVADFYSDKARTVTLSVDGDDAFRVWLNGEKICEAVGELKPRESCTVQQERTDLGLRAGANREKDELLVAGDNTQNLCEAGAKVEVEIFGKRIAAIVAELPLADPNNERLR